MYGGGGSASSLPLLEDSPLVSCGKAAFTSASADDGVREKELDGSIGAKAERPEIWASVTTCLGARVGSGEGASGRYRDEKGGGRGDWLEADVGAILE